MELTITPKVSCDQMWFLKFSFFILFLFYFLLTQFIEMYVWQHSNLYPFELFLYSVHIRRQEELFDLICWFQRERERERKITVWLVEMESEIKKKKKKKEKETRNIWPRTLNLSNFFLFYSPIHSMETNLFVYVSVCVHKLIYKNGKFELGAEESWHWEEMNR